MTPFLEAPVRAAADAEAAEAGAALAAFESWNAVTHPVRVLLESDKPETPRADF